MWFKLGINRRSSIKNQLRQTDSALNADKKVSKNHSDLMLPDRVIATQSSKKGTDMRRHEHFFVKFTF